MFQFDFFLLTEFPVYFILFWTFGIALVPFVFFVSNFVSKARTATILGFAMFLIGSLVQGFVDVVFKDTVNVGIRILFIIQPWALLSQGMKYIGYYAANEQINGMKWSQIGDGFMSVQEVSWLFLVDALIYLVLAIYLDHVMPDENGLRHPVCFCFSPSYWSPSTDRVVGSIEAPSGNKRSVKQSTGLDDVMALLNEEEKKSDDADDDEADELTPEAIEHQLALTKAGLDPDVVKEAKKVRETLDVNYPVRITQLGITFYATVCCCIRQPEKDFQAVRELNLVLDRNSLFCLLGHNGAGKSTTINMMTGLLKPTAGDARVSGYSIKNSMHQIKRIMGVCPQHDVLWNELTAAEHLELFAVFKNLDPALVAKEVNDRLADVGLTKYGNITAGTFSGGMRRRLSVAIALIGDPQIVYLDEPTTGMDSISRRQVWDLIERVKYDRVTVLTTHSMEEADVLGDRIGIMKEGKFICLGSSVRLKNKFGTGYRLTAAVDAELPTATRKAQLKSIQNFFHQNLPEAEVDMTEQSAIRFRIPRAATKKLISFFNILDQNMAELHIIDLQLSLTTLEEVFLSVGAIGEDHADERFGVSSQVGTELSKALKRLEEIRNIQHQRHQASHSEAARAELERREKEEALLGVDNSPEAIERELPFLLEVEAVSEQIELLKNNFERNAYESYVQGTPEQQQHWDAIRASGDHLNLDLVLGDKLRQKSGGTLLSFSGRVTTDTSNKNAEKSGAATTRQAQTNQVEEPRQEVINIGGMIARASQIGLGEGVEEEDEDETQVAPTNTRAIQVHVQPEKSPYPAPDSPPSPVEPGKEAVVIHSDVEMAPLGTKDAESKEELGLGDLCAELAVEQEDMLKNWLKQNLLNKRKPFLHDLRRWWSRLTLVQKILVVVGGLLVLVIIASIVNSVTAGSSDAYEIPVQVFRTEPTLADLPVATWSEVYPSGADYICSRREPFNYYVYKPANLDTSNPNVLVHFGSGDLCYNSATCDPNPATKRYMDNLKVVRASFRAGNMTGLFDKSNPDYPFEDFLHVYIPHCSADGFLGSVDRTYGPGLRVAHKGAYHADVALTWLKNQVPTTTSDIVVTAAGDSVLGASVWAYWIRNQWQDAFLTFISDQRYNLKNLEAEWPSAEFDVKLGPADTPITSYLGPIEDVFTNRVAALKSIYGFDASAVQSLSDTLADPNMPADLETEKMLKAVYDRSVDIGASAKIIQLGTSSGSRQYAKTVAELRSNRQLVQDLTGAGLNPVVLLAATMPLDIYSLYDSTVTSKPNVVSTAQQEVFKKAMSKAICTALNSQHTALPGVVDGNAYTLTTDPLHSLITVPEREYAPIETWTLIESRAFFAASAIKDASNTEYSIATWLKEYFENSHVGPAQASPPSCVDT